MVIRMCVVKILYQYDSLVIRKSIHLSELCFLFLMKMNCHPENGLEWAAMRMINKNEGDHSRDQCWHDGVYSLKTFLFSFS